MKLFKQSNAFVFVIAATAMVSTSAFAQQAGKGVALKSQKIKRSGPITLPEFYSDGTHSDVRTTIAAGVASTQNLATNKRQGGLAVDASIAYEYIGRSTEDLNFSVGADGSLIISGLDTSGRGAINSRLGGESFQVSGGYATRRSALFETGTGLVGIRLRNRNATGEIRYEGGTLNLKELDYGMRSDGLQAKVDGGGEYYSARALIGVSSIEKEIDGLKGAGSLVVAETELLGRLGNLGLGVGYEHAAVNMSRDVKVGSGPAQVIRKENYKSGIGTIKAIARIGF